MSVSVSSNTLRVLSQTTSSSFVVKSISSRSCFGVKFRIARPRCPMEFSPKNAQKEQGQNFSRACRYEQLTPWCKGRQVLAERRSKTSLNIAKKKEPTTRPSSSPVISSRWHRDPVPPSSSASYLKRVQVLKGLLLEFHVAFCVGGGLFTWEPILERERGLPFVLLELDYWA